MIVIWDHYKDDRLLNKRVQFFYDTIEKLIFTFYMYEMNDNYFHHNVLMHIIDEYGKYIGLFISPEKTLIFVNFNIKGVRYTLDTFGKFIEGDFEPGASSTKASFFNGRENKYSISHKELLIIKSFLENLRSYWNENL